MNKIPKNNESSLDPSLDQSSNERSRSNKPDDTIDKIAKEIEMKLENPPDLSNLNDTGIRKGIGIDNTLDRINNINEILDQVDASGFFGFLGLHEELNLFGKSLQENVQKEFNEIMYSLINKEESAMQMIPVLFAFSILKNSAEVSEKLFQEFKEKIKIILDVNEYRFSDLTKSLVKKKIIAIEHCLLILLKKKYDNFAMDFLNQTSYIAYDDKLIKEAINNKSYSFLILLLKKTKSGLFSRHEESSGSGNHTKQSLVTSFRDMVQSQMSIKQEDLKNLKKEKSIRKKKTLYSDDEIFNSNKLIMQALEDNQEKVAIKIMYYYSLKFSIDFMIPKTLYYGIEKNYFLFFKKYYDMYPFSHFNILNFDSILKAIKMINNRETFIHSLFLLSKINAITLSEIHVRLIIDQFETLWNTNLYFFTYMLNPILVCVLICEICHKLSDIFTNVKVRLNIEASNYLLLAKLIKDQINDELFIKTIYLRKFYPANKTLLQILYFRRDFYSPLLKSDLISEIVEDLWYCDYYHTYNVFNTSSAYQNLKGKLYITENINSNIINQNSVTNSPTYSPSIKQVVSKTPNTNPLDNSKYQNLLNSGINNPALIDENAIKLTQLKNITLKNPFHFIRKTNILDYKFTNHVFSFFYWQKSPSFRVILEGMIYLIFFVLIVQNAFESFRLRRIFIAFPENVLILIDTFIGLRYSIPPAPEFYGIITPWMIKNKVSDPRVAIYLASIQPSFCEGLLMFVPDFKDSCGLFAEASENFWDLAEIFIRNQFFFYFTFLGTALEMIYTYVIHKKFWFNAKVLIDLVITGTNIYIQYVYFSKIDGKLLIIRDGMLEQYAFVETNMLVFVFLMWLKFFIYLKLTKTFGYVIKVIEIMVVDLLDFLVIFSIIILAFSLIIYDLLSESHENFSNLIITIRSLLFITYGQVFFEGFRDNETLGSILITIFSIISVIILLSLLVAILNNTYRTIFDRSNLENASIFYTNYLARKPDKYRSALISFPPPVNILIIPFIPFLIIKKSSRLNHFICMSGYSLFVIAYMSIYIAGNIFIIIPLCWLKYIISIYIHVIIRIGNIKSYLLVLLWTFGGLFYLLYNLFRYDIFIFWKSLFNESKNKDCLDEITLEEIDLIKKTALQLSYSKTYVTYNEFYDAIRNDLDVLNKKLRKNQLQLNLKSNDMISNKMLKLNFYKNYSENNKDFNNSPSLPNSAKKHVEKNLRQFVEIDKMEVFSLIRQYSDVNSFILLKRMVELLDLLKYCKKLHILQIDRKKKLRIGNFVQIVDILATEKAVLGILSSNLKSMEQFDLVNNYSLENNNFNKEFNEENKNQNHLRSSVSFMNDVLKFTATKRKTIEENKEKKKNIFNKINVELDEETNKE